jgi:BTB/POZ domain-containing protein KCTD9
MSRLSYEDSCRQLQKKQLLAPNAIPPQPSQPPRHDDATPGVRLFNTLLANRKLDSLTLPRTFISRSEFRSTSFRDTDLSESTAHWNDFISVNFTSADLSASDFRGCVFQKVRFCSAKLAGVDFRYCGFTHCDFTDADLTDAKLTTKVGRSLRLSPEQQSAIDWQGEDGEDPPAGNLPS